ncbi:MAG: bifunctional alpha,alpha-trehalose-phosphate synthase (UDP-forming)/trehalose-phosphatase [Candidatus Cyclobacteriaceae bacterium M3_2C_046]
MSKTIIVSNRLPVKIQRKDQDILFKPSEGGLATGLGSIYKEGNNLWIGWPGLFLDDEEEQELVTGELQKESMYPVFLTKKEIKEYYEGFSNATLWPTFHYFNQFVVYNKTFWKAYQLVNEKFCQVISRLAQPGDLIWVHDYQLLLLPGMIRKQIPECSIGFFQHIPFASYEVFRLLPWRREILKGMLGADLIGFHTYDDTRHFLSAVNRLVGISDTNGQLEVDQRLVFVDAFPMGIDYKKYEDAANSDTTQRKEKLFRKSLGQQKMVLSIDRLDYSKGIPQKLMAFEDLLAKNPDMEGEISLVMIVVPSRDNVEKYKLLKEQIDELAGRINARFSTIQWRPVHYFYRSFPLDDLATFYRMADIALITPMRDGMNLVSKEFIASKTDKKGVLILSEMAGASKELYDALIINPNDIDEIVQAMEAAIHMSEDDMIRSMTSMQNIVRLYDIHNWVELFVDRLAFVNARQKYYSAQPLEQSDKNKILKDFNQSENRLIFIDLDNTLLPVGKYPSITDLQMDVLEFLQALSQQRQNRLICLSGTDTHTLDNIFQDLPVDLVAEHGMQYREQGKQWKVSEKISNDWKMEIFPVLEHFVKRTPGSYIEEKDYSLVWHYKKAETGLGELRTRELTEHLKYLVSNMNLNVVDENMIIEIKSSLINKGRSTRYWLDKYYADFILALGGDATAEDIFRVLPENAYSVKLGRSHTTSARYNVLKTEALFDILRQFVPRKLYNLN